MMSENMISSSLLSPPTVSTRRPLPMAEIESSVSKLLLTTKKLLETLTAWSSKQVDDKEVYEVYNTLERHFASATEAFESALLPMDDMLHFPNDLFNCLKDALSKEQSSTTLEEYLPLIRDIILKLLQGLKKKQFLLRERFEQQNSSSNNIPLPLPSPSSSTETTPFPRLMMANRTETPLSTPTSATFNNNHPDSSKIPLFLKFNDRIKRTTIDPSAIIDINTLKTLFAKKFGLQQDNIIDTILVLDNESNVEYELEDLTDIQPYTILSIKSQGEEKEELNDEMKSLFKETMHQVLQSIKEKEFLKKEGEMKNELNQLKQDLVDLNQMYTNFRKGTESIITELREKSVSQTEEKKEIVVIQNNDNNKAHDEMNKDKEMTHKISAIIINRLEELQDKIDQIKLDVTQKRCRPSKIQLNYCQQESKQLEIELNHLSTKLKLIKPIWKKTWETQLQQIVKEQQFFKEQELLLVDLKEDYENVTQVLNQLYKIFEINERKKKFGSTPFNNRKEDFEDFEDGMSSVIKQVATIEVNHTKRLEALNQAEQKRSKELSSRIDEFERELTNFVGLNKLKSIGGPEAVDQKRQEKDETLIKQIFVQQQKQRPQSNDDVIHVGDTSSSLLVPNLEIIKNGISVSSLLEDDSNFLVHSEEEQLSGGCGESTVLINENAAASPHNEDPSAEDNDINTVHSDNNHNDNENDDIHASLTPTISSFFYKQLNRIIE